VNDDLMIIENETGTGTGTETKTEASVIKLYTIIARMCLPKYLSSCTPTAAKLKTKPTKWRQRTKRNSEKVKNKH